MNRLRLIPVLLAAALVAGAASAGDGRGGEAGFFLGAVFPDASVAGEASPPAAATFGGRAGVVFTRRFTWFVDGTWAEIDSQTPFGKAEELSGRTGFELLLRPASRFGWFLNAGAGWLVVDYERGGNLDFNRPLGSAGGGSSIRWGATKRIRLEWRGDYALNREGLGREPVFQGRFLVGLTWGPSRVGGGDRGARGTDSDRGGGGDRTPAGSRSDLDGDGVRNRGDRCPDTPGGAFVDRAGCPRDGDRDGVYDGIDRCPDTPAFVVVDVHGCLADADGDGVHDGADACPETPVGAVVDDWGCPEDRDRDGCPDGLDRCPGTPLGAVVDGEGCAMDGDQDGVVDGIDRCDGTPLGTVVDRYGCPVGDEP